jgi:hypothetical protein
MTRIAAICLAFSLLPVAAEAQNRNCGPREKVLTTLAEKYQESRRSIGLATQGRVMEVFASEESGSWTIIVTMPNGITCLVASGQAFENVDEGLQPAGVRS